MRVRIKISGYEYVVCPATFCQDEEGHIRILFSDITVYGKVTALKSLRSALPVNNFGTYSYELLSKGWLDLIGIPFDYTH